MRELLSKVQVYGDVVNNSKRFHFGDVIIENFFRNKAARAVTFISEKYSKNKSLTPLRKQIFRFLAFISNEEEHFREP